MDNPIVEIIWRDAVSDEGIFNEERIREVAPLIVTSIGALWLGDNDKVVIARDIFPENNYRGTLTIPRESIIRMRQIA